MPPMKMNKRYGCLRTGREISRRVLSFRRMYAHNGSVDGYVRYIHKVGCNNACANVFCGDGLLITASTSIMCVETKGRRHCMEEREMERVANTMN